MLWDLLLYVPTVTALAVFAISTFYDDKVPVAYLLGFLACFFLIAGANRILTTRLMLLPAAPVALEASGRTVEVHLRNGTHVTLLSTVKIYRDTPPRSFGLSGLDGAGRRHQFIFHRGQFGSDEDFKSVIDAIDRAVRQGS
jgi:hypothetical protein